MPNASFLVMKMQVYYETAERNTDIIHFWEVCDIFLSVIHKLNRYQRQTKEHTFPLLSRVAMDDNLPSAYFHPAKRPALYGAATYLQPHSKHYRS
jgi:hypothetical protein